MVALKRLICPTDYLSYLAVVTVLIPFSFRRVAKILEVNLGTFFVSIVDGITRLTT